VHSVEADVDRALVAEGFEGVDEKVEEGLAEEWFVGPDSEGGRAGVKGDIDGWGCLCAGGSDGDGFFDERAEADGGVVIGGGVGVEECGEFGGVAKVGQDGLQVFVGGVVRWEVIGCVLRGDGGGQEDVVEVVGDAGGGRGVGWSLL